MKKNILLFTWIIILIIFAITDYIFWDKHYPGLSKEWGSISHLLLIFQIFYIFGSWRKGKRGVGPSDVATVLFFNKPIKDTEAGASPWIPLWICKLKVLKNGGLTLSVEFPAEPGKIYDEDGNIPEGKVPPFKIPTGKLVDPKDPLENTMILKPRVVVRFRIKSYSTFIKVVGELEKLLPQLSDSVQGALYPAFISKCPKDILKDWEEINGILFTAMKKLVGDTTSVPHDWGLEIVSVKMTDAGIDKKIITAMDEVPKAEYEKKSGIIRAELEAETKKIGADAEAEKIKKTGSAEATKIGDIGKAENDVLKEKYAIKTKDGRTVAVAFAEALAKNTGLRVISLGGSDLKTSLPLSSFLADDDPGTLIH
ncbi:MAG: SPFH domain-containing protein [Candidatus Paceibacterota bacterium]|jgi:hypothetical protein